MSDKLVDIELDLSEFSKDQLIALMQISCDQNISINQVFTDLVIGFLEHETKDV